MAFINRKIAFGGPQVPSDADKNTPLGGIENGPQRKAKTKLTGRGKSFFSGYFTINAKRGSGFASDGKTSKGPQGTKVTPKF